MEVGFRTYSDNSFFLKGYNIDALTVNQQRRALWYDMVIRRAIQKAVKSL